jgi:hypothetical protein
MTATNSGVTPQTDFTYVNQLLFYSRDQAKDDAGNTLSITGHRATFQGYSLQLFGSIGF